MPSLTVHTVCTKEDYQQIEKKELPRENKEEKRKVIIVLVQRRVRSSTIEDGGGSAALLVAAAAAESDSTAWILSSKLHTATHSA